MYNPERRRRAVHKLAVTAAALAVCVLPTACDYPLASPAGAPTAPIGGTPGDGSTTSAVVVPVGNTSDAASQRVRDGVRDGDRRDRDGTRTSKPRPTTPPVKTSPTTPPVVPPPSTAPPTTPPPATIAPGDILGKTCQDGDPQKKFDNVNLPAHTGFQATAAQCVSTQMGAVAADGQLPSLLITAAPTKAKPGDPIILRVSTRNLVRDRFLGAAAGGYYLESSFLDDKGLQRGHFHTACRMISASGKSPSAAPVVERQPFFVATQDGGGGAKPDSVTVEVVPKGKTTAGTMQCASWAGDGSHRTPMMSFANQIPAFDSVRINIGGNAAALPDEPAAGAPAAAQADAQRLVESQQQQAGQAPDQDGAAEPAGQDNAPAAGDSAAPAPVGDSSAPASSPDAPAATGQSLSERFSEIQESREAGEG